MLHLFLQSLIEMYSTAETKLHRLDNPALHFSSVVAIH